MERILKNHPLAIIVPFMGLMDYTERMIDSIKTIHPYKVMLIDNGRTLESKKWLSKMTKKKNVEALSFKVNIGVASSWNTGIMLAMDHWGSQIYFIPNNDILLHPKAIDLLCDRICDPDIALITATDVCGKIVEPTDIYEYKIPKKEELVEAPEFSCFMTKIETVNKIGLFDTQYYPAYFEDNDYHYRLKLASMKSLKTNRAVYYHYGSRTIKQSKKILEISNAGYAINRDYYESKWGGLPGHETRKVPKIV